MPLDMKLKLLLLPLLAAMAWSPVLAQSTDPAASPEAGNHQRWRNHGERFLDKLNLSDQQRDQIKKFRADNRAAFRTAMLNYLTAEKALREAIHKNPTDEATISSLSASANSARTQMTIQRAKIQALIASILTPEQHQTWDQMHEKNQDRLQKRIDRLNQSST
jgi:Spy/CpxP family protein refolding chaperone